MGLIGDIWGAHNQASAAQKAADAQTKAAEEAKAGAQAATKGATDFNTGVYNQDKTNLNPYIQAGKTAVGTLDSDMTNGTFAPWSQTFSSPTAVTEQNDPGFQFRLQQGTQALDRSAAAKGGLLTGGTAKAEQRYGQDYASNEYGNVYNRALQNYQTNYSTFRNNQQDTYARLSGIANSGLSAAGTLGGYGAEAARNNSTSLLSGANLSGQYGLDAGAARASGYIGKANAYSQGISNVNNDFMQAALLAGGM